MADPEKKVVRIDIVNEEDVDPRHNSHESAHKVRKELNADVVGLFVVNGGNVSVSVVGEDTGGDITIGLALINSLRETADELEEKIKGGIKKAGGNPKEYGL